MCEKFNEAVSLVVSPIRENLLKIPLSTKLQVSEIRLRAERPIVINVKNKFYFLSKEAKLQSSVSEKTIRLSQLDIQNTFTKMCNHSVYSYQNEIKNGFITLKGGHRVGICGTAVLDKGNVTNLRDINSLNIRVAQDVSNLASNWKDIFLKDFTGVLIVGEPASGKTTILRNLAHKFSSGVFGGLTNVSVIDERNEIAASNCGISHFNLGFCDILTGYPKSVGFEHAIRTLSPEIIICDELGTKQDVKAIREAVNSGVKIIATFHSRNIFDFINNVRARNILKTYAFDKIIFLKGKSKPGEIFKIYHMEDLKDEIRRSNNAGSFVGSNGVFSIA